MNKSDFVLQKDGNWENVSVENLEIVSQKEYRSISRKKRSEKSWKICKQSVIKKIFISMGCIKRLMHFISNSY